MFIKDSMTAKNKMTDFNFLEKIVSKFDKTKFMASILLFAFVMTIVCFLIIVTQFGPNFLGSEILALTYVLVIYLAFVRKCVDRKIEIKKILEILEDAQNKPTKTV